MRTTTQDNKAAIAEALKTFGRGSLRANATQLFNTLGYLSEKTIELSPNTPENFLNEIDQHNRFRKDKALLSRWKSVDFIFQITGEEINSCASGQISLQFDAHKKIDNRIIESYLFLAIKLRKGHYTRTDLSTITREINKLFPMPVLILFQHGDTLTLSVINRRLHKREQSKDVLEKVTLIKDIAFGSPHRAHIEILSDLSFTNLYDRYRFSNFVTLHDAWKKTLDSSELNKRFFREVANWYFWAIQNVTFPKDAGADEEIRNATSVIRLITRLIFVWFIKEKGLVPDDLFNKSKLDDILKYNDAKQSSYYKAILQNLFFATLNQEMNTPKKPDNRQFRNKAKNPGGRDQHYMIHNVYRYESCFKNPDKALELFSTIPFLNGGLFECLDKPDKDNPKKILRIDGFSDRKDNEFVVPDFLFFSEEQEVDLNKSFGTKNKQYKVKGLIDIFDSYKFTINENTPIEEEVALDPELLGKVFENLLAAYNPETGSTARKQTGSFYTPREIVDYMVDESLKASLSNLAAEKIVNCSEEDIKTGLDILFTYTEKEHAFNNEEVSKIVRAVSELKILDPACGSGAFPMGVLHKLVYILGKLDPDNTLWRDLQKQRAIRETEEAYDMGNKEERHQRLAEIEKTFNFNTSDYGRKLYLIENCIYGVDIQPIATQIAKLRFFISLVVDQKIDNARDNRGILPLPNLETNFVAANTLINVEKPQQGKLPNLEVRPQITQKERELASVRRNHFIARTLKTKRKCRDRDAQLRADISDLLKKEAFLPVTTQKLAYWDPYDQNASADFFDPEWMFNISDGFDVVIGNPPYIRIQMLRQTDPDSAEYLKAHYDAAKKGNYDIYVVFVERSLSLLNSNGRLAFILPHKFFNAQYGLPLRKLLSAGHHISQIVHFGDYQVFPGSTNYVCLLFLCKPGCKTFRFVKVDDYENWLYSRNGMEGTIQASKIGALEWNFVVGKGSTLFEKLCEMPIKLGDAAHIFVGLQTSADDVFIMNVIRQGDQSFILESKALHSEVVLEKDLLFPLVSGTDVKTYGILPERQYILFPYRMKNGKVDLLDFDMISSAFPKTASYLLKNRKRLESRESGRMKGNKWFGYIYLKNMALQNTPKICVPRLVEVLHCAYDEQGSHFLDNVDVCGIRLKSEHIKHEFPYLLALLNSSVLKWFFPLVSATFRGGWFSANRQFLSQLPFRQIDFSVPHDRSRWEELLRLANEILAAKRGDPNVATTAIEAEIDARVAHLYKLTEEEYSLILSELKPPDPFRIAALNFYRNIARGKIK